jgi:hypothetical protein
MDNQSVAPMMSGQQIGYLLILDGDYVNISIRGY